MTEEIDNLKQQLADALEHAGQFASDCDRLKEENTKALLTISTSNIELFKLICANKRLEQENELLTKVAEAAAFIADWQPSTHEEYKELKSALSAWRKWKEKKYELL